MAHDTAVSTGIRKIFEHRQSFIVIGLTGRTGSGCSTVAGLLSHTNFRDIKMKQLNDPPPNHETRKDRIVRSWLDHENNWRQFQIIQVSQVLLMMATAQSVSKLISFIRDVGALHAISAENLESIEAGSASYEAGCGETYSTLTNLQNSESVTEDEVKRARAFISQDLPKFANLVRVGLKAVNRALYTAVFQSLGDNVRSSGDPLSNTPDPERLLLLPQTISRIIKLYRMEIGQLSGSQGYFAIDALRHPYEIRYLRERIAPFYVIAVTTNDVDRRARLSEAGLPPEEIERLDGKEYPKEKKRQDTYPGFVSQDIQACLSLSDIYLNNPGHPKDKDFRDLAQQVCRYVALMQRPGIITPTAIERCMQVAFTAKLNSGCISRQVGASITDENFSVKAIGWNDVPQRQVPCLLRNTGHLLDGKDEHAYSEFERGAPFSQKLRELRPGRLSCDIVDGKNNPYCFKSIYNKWKDDDNQVHTRSLHAEENAFLQLAKYGSPGIRNGNLFTTASPCELCAKKAYQLGMKNVYYVDPYPGISNSHILASGAARPTVTLFSGAIGRAYHDLYEPVMPMKDELDEMA